MPGTAATPAAAPPPASRHPRAAVVRAVVAPLLLALLAGCGGQERWNVVLVTFDTTRADRLGCYGNDTVDTPTVDALAAEGVRFERALSAIPITLPSHSTILTGKYPPGHGVRDNGLFVLAEEQETLAEILQGHGYATGAAVGAFPLVARFGVDQGFDHFDDRLSSGGLGVLGGGALAAPRLFFEERRAARVNEAVFDWLEAVASDPFFLLVHYYDPHQPHEPPPPYDQLYANDRYDGEIAYADESLGVLLDRLRSLGVYDRTLVVFTSDHGEGLGEHGELTHSYLVYDTTLHVPLIFRLPGGAGGGRVVAEPVRLVDLLPTILDLLELPAPDGLDGRSLETVLEGGATSPRPHYAESLSARFNHNWGELRALYDGGWKYIHGPRPELYDLGADPRELRDLAAAEPEVAERMRSALAGFLERRAAASASVASVPDAETRERLQALGYLQGGGGEPATVNEELRDEGTPPQDRIGDVSAMSQVRSLLVQGRAFAAQQIAEELIRRDPVNPFYLEVLANTQLQLGQVDGARETIERLGELGPLRDPGRLLALRLGHALYLRGAREEGLARVRRIVEEHPDAEGHHLLAVLLGDLGDPGAEAALRRALELDPAYTPARVDLAIRLDQGGDPDAAREHFRRALADDPYAAAVHFNYGAFLMRRDPDPEAALGPLRRAVELRPEYPGAYRALVVLHLRLGRLDDAEAALATLESRWPGSPPAASARRLYEEVRGGAG